MLDAGQEARHLLLVEGRTDDRFADLRIDIARNGDDGDLFKISEQLRHKRPVLEIDALDETTVADRRAEIELVPGRRTHAAAGQDGLERRRGDADFLRDRLHGDGLTLRLIRLDIDGTLRDDHGGPRLFGRGQEGRKRMARQRIVRIQERHVFADGLFKTRIARAREAAVLLGEDAHARILRRIGRKRLARLVRRTVVDAQEFEVSESLGQDRLDRGGNRRFGLVHGHDDGDLRHVVQLYHESREGRADVLDGNVGDLLALERDHVRLVLRGGASEIVGGEEHHGLGTGDMRDVRGTRIVADDDRSTVGEVRDVGDRTLSEEVDGIRISFADRVDLLRFGLRAHHDGLEALLGEEARQFDEAFRRPALLLVAGAAARNEERVLLRQEIEVGVVAVAHREVLRSPCNRLVDITEEPGKKRDLAGARAPGETALRKASPLQGMTRRGEDERIVAAERAIRGLQVIDGVPLASTDLSDDHAPPSGHVVAARVDDDFVEEAHRLGESLEERLGDDGDVRAGMTLADRAHAPRLHHEVAERAMLDHEDVLFAHREISE